MVENYYSICLFECAVCICSIPHYFFYCALIFYLPFIFVVILLSQVISFTSPCCYSHFPHVFIHATLHSSIFPKSEEIEHFNILIIFEPLRKIFAFFLASLITFFLFCHIMSFELSCYFHFLLK